MRAPSLRCEIGERLDAARRIDRSRAQQLGQFMRRGKVEAAIGSAREPRDLAERLLGDRVVALLKHEGRHAEQPELAGRGRQIVDRFFHRVADIDQRRHLALVALRARVAQHLADLRMAALASDARHQVAEAGAVRDPARGAAFVQAAEIDELHVEPADRSQPRGTSRPAACRRYPRSAAGSWWRRARRSAGRAGRPRSAAQACGRAERTRRSRRAGDVAAGSLRVSRGRGGGLVAFVAIGLVAGIISRLRPIRWHPGVRRNGAVRAGSSHQVVGFERLVLRGDPFGARRRTPPPLLVDRQFQLLDQLAHLLPGGQMRQVRPRAERRLVEVVERGQAAAGRTRGTPRARKTLRSARKPRRSPSRSRHSPTIFLLREPSSARRLRTTIQSVSPPSTMRRWRRA